MWLWCGRVPHVAVGGAGCVLLLPHAVVVPVVAMGLVVVMVPVVVVGRPCLSVCKPVGALLGGGQKRWGVQISAEKSGKPPAPP